MSKSKKDSTTETGSVRKDEKPSQYSEPENPFSPSKLRLPQNFSDMAGVKKQLTVIKVHKPGKQDFIRVHPGQDFCLQTPLLELKEEGETYLVDPPLWNDLSGELVPKVLYLTINRQGVIRLWPIRLPDEDGKLDDWNQSAREAAEIAKKKWVRVSSNLSARMYDTFEASGDFSEPEWPELSLSEILEIAFRGKYIKDWDHPALRRLRGED